MERSPIPYGGVNPITAHNSSLHAWRIMHCARAWGSHGANRALKAGLPRLPYAEALGLRAWKQGITIK